LLTEGSMKRLVASLAVGGALFAAVAAAAQPAGALEATVTVRPGQLPGGVQWPRCCAPPDSKIQWPILPPPDLQLKVQLAGPTDSY